MRLLKRLLKWLVFLVGLAIFFFFVGVGLFNWVIMPRVARLGREVEVPEVGGKSLGEAVKVLEEGKLTHFVESREFDPLVPEGYVISQDPPSGGMVKEGRRVSLRVSLGPETVAIPHLKDLTLQQAKNLLRASGLTAGEVSEVYSDSVLSGRVVASSPPFDSLVRQGTEVNLVVSKGVLTMEMPNLIGQRLATVKASLDTRGLVIGEVKELVGEDVEEGTILLQSPQPGAQVSRGDTVRLAVSSKE